MWPKRKHKAEQLEVALQRYSEVQRPLPGIADAKARSALAMQMVASLRRLDYTAIVRSRSIHPDRAHPGSHLFDPEKAALFHAHAGRLDEAIWLVFLATHFGKHGRYGWKRVRDVYSGMGSGVWTWERVSNNPADFRNWLRDHESKIGGAFGNHRKYESLKANSPKGTASVIESYVQWIGPSRSHAGKIRELVRTAGNDPHKIFDAFYKNMNVRRFGRLGKFDFLALLGRMDLAPVSPGSAYLTGATGPLAGARLLFGGDAAANLNEETLEEWLTELDEELNVGMQVMEDSLCNWQKSPLAFVHFRG